MKLRFWTVALRLANPWLVGSASGQAKARTLVPNVFVELRSADGAIGLGEAPTSTYYRESIEGIEAFLHRVQADRLSFGDIAGSLAYLDSLGEGHRAAKGALDLALHDGAAFLAGKTVYDHLGLGFAEGRHVTSFSIGLAEPDVVRERARWADIYPRIKLKLGMPNDQERLRCLREVAPEKPVRVDANEAWLTKEQALENLEWLAADGRVEFVEQPMPVTSDPEDLAWLRRRSPLPLYADESFQSVSDVALCRDCYDGVNVKLLKLGGITGSEAALLAARQAGLRTMLGCMIESGLLITAAAHLAELADHLDLDGNLLLQEDPVDGVRCDRGVLSFAELAERKGLCVRLRSPATG